MPETREVYDAAVAHQRAGRIADAEAGYRAVIAAAANFAEAHNNLGVIAINREQVDEAIAHYNRALAARPDFPEALNNLASVIRGKGDFDGAIELYRKAIQHAPVFAAALQNLSVTLLHIGKAAEAITLAERAVAAQPNFPEALNTLCIALRQTGRAADAVARGREAIAQRPTFADAYNNLGLALGDLGQSEDAIAAFRTALQVQPIFPEASHNLATALAGRNDYDQAIHYFREALVRLPDSPETLSNLGMSLFHCGRFDEAVEAYTKSLALRPDPAVASNRIYCLTNHPSQDVAALRDAQRDWAKQYAEPLKQFWPRHANERTIKRRLRIGYVSPDFHNHPVGRFMLPLLANHNSERVEVFCYSDTHEPDELTEKLKSHAAVWRETRLLSDEQLARQILEDRIDILVDLTMHLRRNRLLCFARKPAPVQVSYLAYPGTTGLDAIDYRLTDIYLDPPNGEQAVGSELPVHLQSYWCYQAHESAPDVSDLPALKNGFITFGCFNNFAKVSAAALEAWGAILHRVPKSRLILHAPDGEPRQRVRNRLGDRVNFVGFSDTATYLQSYRHVDIALDPFPIVGGTTTCDALWSGVPVVTLSGDSPITRSGQSIFHNLGLEKLFARSTEQYISIATTLASRLEPLAALRATMRTQMLQSRLMDAVAFTRDLESKLLTMWLSWVDSPAALQPPGV